MLKGIGGTVVAAAVVVGAAGPAAAVIIDTVHIGNPGNAPDTRYDPMGFGGVGYTYTIGKFEVTAGQYTEFLNAVAAMDTYGLYHTLMADPVVYFGANIQRSGSPGSFTYSVAADWANRPVNYVSWGDAARFANWLHNGQPMGPQGLSTTEDGSYFLNGATSNAALMMVVRKPGATWIIPTEDEWYKAAYHKNDGATGNYWDYPTRSNVFPTNGNPGGDTGNSANFYDGDYAVGSPHWRTPVGYFGFSDSPYGTYDQGGNVWEWNEAVVDFAPYRGVRGMSFYVHADGGPGYYLQASARNYYFPVNEDGATGFRVSAVPEPATITMLMLALASGGLLRKRRE